MEKKEKFIVPVVKAFVARIEVEAASADEAKELAVDACEGKEVPNSAFCGLMADMEVSPFIIESSAPVLRAGSDSKYTYSLISGPVDPASNTCHPMDPRELAAMEIFDALRGVEDFVANTKIPGLFDENFSSALDALSEAVAVYEEYLGTNEGQWLNWEERPESVRVYRDPDNRNPIPKM